jgi:subtilisin family serine protease
MKSAIQRTAAGLALAALVATAIGCAPARVRVERADQLPRFSYAVPADLESVVRDRERFAALAQQIRRDAESTLAGYDIAERATQRQLIGLLMQLDLLEGRPAEALRRADQVQALQEKPADKLLSGLTARAIAQAQQRGLVPGTREFTEAVTAAVTARLEQLPYAVIRNDIERAKSSMETVGETLVMGRVREVLQPVARQSGTLSSDLAPSLVAARYGLDFTLPLKTALARTYADYLQRHRVERPNIWAARDVALPPGRGLAPVTIVVWDSGIDAQLFGGQVVQEEAKSALVAFDRYGVRSAEPLKPIPADLQGRLPELQRRSKGFSDLTSNIDSPEAAEVRELMSNLPAERFRTVQEESRLTGVYQHGTHVAGIAMAGNPYARLANARIEFGHTLRPDPCPSRELSQRSADNFAAYADFIRRTGARVVNMSWGGNVRAYESALEQCGLGGDAASRKALARELYQIQRDALTRALTSLPDVLFVVSAGNAANDPTFNETYPSGIVLPNVVAVGAVDQAGDEAPFTSYGPTVKLHANGYQVDSWVPGGRRIAISGTSMSAPQVTNLAAKLLAVQPSLKPAELIALMERTADRSEDGRRVLVHPARALAAIGFR